MVRKRRTEASSEGGEGSVPREVGQASGPPGGGRGGSQRGGLQQGGGGGHQQGGRGYNTQSQQGGRGGGRGYGQPPQQQYQQQQQYGRGPQEYQGRGRGPPQIQSFPEPHQANSPTLSEVSPTKMPEHSGLVQQVEQLSLEQGAPSQAIQPLPSSSKAYKFPMRPGKGQSGKHCIVKDNPFFTELPDEDLQSLGDGLESWPGFYQSIRPTQMGSSLNIDMPSTAFIEALPVINFVCELLNRDISSWPLSDADLVKELVSHRLCPKMLSLSPQEEEMRLGAYSLSELEEALQGTLERELKATRMMIEDKDIQEWLGKAFKKHISEFGTSGFVDCFLHKSTKTSLFTDNFILKWISPARSHENKPVPKEIRSKKWIKEQKQGPVRAQDGHVICTLYAATDLISSLRLIEHRDTDFRVLSVKELCYFCGESERLTYTNRNIKHRCHSYSFSEVFAYIKAKGVVEELESETSFNCCDDPPVVDGREKYYIEDWIDMGHDLAKVYEQLKLGPVGASVLVFVPEYYATYRPTSNSSRFLCGHAINIMSVWVDADGQPVFYCKSSHGTEAHDGGFLRVSGSVCLLGGNFLSGQEKGPELGLHNEDGHTLTYSRPLIGNFVVPVIKKKRGLAAPAVTKASKRLKKGKKKVESSDSSDSESEEEEKRKKTPAKAASSSDESSDDEPATKKAAAATNGSVAKKAKDNSSSEDDSSDEEVAATKKT